jgi:phosphoglycolate phosphatase-like HAD superfamily hydrolase
VKARKPAPDVLLECLRRLGSQSERSVYVGDSPIDIIAAKAAGVHSIGVLSGASDRASLEEVEPELILDHVGQLPAVLRTEELGR